MRADTDSRIWRYEYTVLALAVVAYFGIRFSEFVLSPVLPQVKSGLGVSTGVVGLAFTGSTVSYALAQLPSGVLGDRFGERTVILTAIGLTGVGSVLLAVSPSGLVLVVAMTILGAVSGAYYSPATALLTDLFDDTGRAIGVHRLGAQVVGFTAPIVAFVAATYHWRVALLLGAVVALPVFVGFRFAVEPREPVNAGTPIRERVRPAKLTALLSRPSIAFTTVVASFAQFADTATFSFLPALLQEYHGLPLQTAGLLFTVYFAALTVAQPIAGWSSDRIGRDSTTAVAVAIGVLGYVALLADSVVLVTVGVACTGIGMGWGPPVQARFMDSLSETERGMGFGLVRTVYIGFAALGGVSVGTIVTLAGWYPAIVLLGGVMAVPLLAIGANWLLRLDL